MILISACLLGRCVKYNGSHNLAAWLARVYDPIYFMVFCPEILAGFSLPRPPVELQHGDGIKQLAAWRENHLHEEAQSGDTPSIHNKLGEDITAAFMREADLLPPLVHKFSIKAAILKEGSPSCGFSRIYDGRFCGVKIPGMGVAAAVLTEMGIPCYSEETLTKEKLQELLQAAQEELVSR